MSFKPENLEIIDIHIYKFNAEYNPDNYDEIEQAQGVGYSYDQEHGFAMEDSLFRMQLNVLAEIKDGEDAEPMATSEIGVRILIKIDNLSDMIGVQDGEIVDVDDTLMASLAGITYSTVRGVFYQETTKVLPSGIILPIIEPTSLFLD